MVKTARKLNFLIEETICKDLEKLVPAGKRSRIVNEALRKELELLRRKSAVESLLISTPDRQGYSNARIVATLTKDRASH
jgi:hypothetical protein